MSDRVIHISDPGTLDDQIKSKDLLICFFTAEWCGSCRALSPTFAILSNEFSNAKFLKVDIDMVKDHNLTKNIRSVPSFLFFKDGQIVQEFITGATENDLRSAIHTYIKS